MLEGLRDRTFECLDDLQVELHGVAEVPSSMPAQPPIAVRGGCDPAPVPSDANGSIASPAIPVADDTNGTRRGHAE